MRDESAGRLAGRRAVPSIASVALAVARRGAPISADHLQTQVRTMPSGAQRHGIPLLQHRHLSLSHMPTRSSVQALQPHGTRVSRGRRKSQIMKREGCCSVLASRERGRCISPEPGGDLDVRALVEFLC